MDHHLTPAELEGLMLGGLSKEQVKDAVLHLLRGCEPCRALVAPHLPTLFGPGSRFQAIPPPPPDVYDLAMDRVFARLGLKVPRKSPEETRQEALAFLASGGLEGIEDAPADLRGLPLFEALLERSWSLRHEDPEQMVQLARFAALLADRLDASEVGPLEVEDLRCRAWMELANAYRVRDDLDEAEDAINEATDHLLGGTRNDLLTARFFTVMGSHGMARRHFAIAATSFDIAAHTYHLQGDDHLAGRALVLKGLVAGYSGAPEEAIRLIEQGLSTVDESRDPGLVFSALQSQAWLLADCGRFTEAIRKVSRLKWRRSDTGGRLGELKLRWLEGHVRSGMGELDRAERSLAEVKEGFEEAGLGFKAALAGLELGTVWFRQGRIEDTERIVQECAAVFLSLQIHRELRASVLLLQRAGETRKLTLDILQQVIARLHKAELDPGAPATEEP